MVAVLCTCLERRLPGQTVADLVGAVRSRVAGEAVPVLAAPACADPGGLAAAVRSLGSRRVVVGCLLRGAARDDISARLRGADLPPAGIRLLDLTPVAQPELARVVAQVVASVLAAIASLARADLAAPARERLVAGHVGRRGLLLAGSVPRRQVASWIKGPV